MAYERKPPYTVWIVLVLQVAGCWCLSGAASAEKPPQPPEPPACHVTAGDLELYGTFHALGVTLRCDPLPEGAKALLEYRKASEKAFRQGFPLARLKDRFMGSLFWLEPGAAYDVRVTVNDRGFAGACSTRKEIVVPDPLRRR
jgi:hypothetical protein